MYSVFEKLCKEKGVTPSAVAIACGFAPSVVSRWKSGESNPKSDKLKKIADYFGVSVQFIMTGEGEVELHVPAEQVAKEVADMLHENPVLLNMLYDFRDITEAWEQRLKGYYDALSNYERRKESS